MMLFFIVVTTLLAALCNAAAALLQRRAVGAPHPRELYRRKLIRSVSTSRLWLMGFGLQVVAGVLEVIALYHGTLVLVEPLLVTDLVFLLFILHFHYGVKSGAREWLGVALVFAGLSTLLSVASPKGGHMEYSGLVWTITALIIAPLMLLGVLLTRRISSHKLRAGVGALTAGLSFGFSAALTKLVLEQLQSGIGNVITGWALYAAIVSAVIAIIASQSAYGAGPIAITQPVIEITSPTVSVILGITIFDEFLTSSTMAVLAESLGAILTVVGIILLGTSKRIIDSESHGSLLAGQVNRLG